MDNTEISDPEISDPEISDPEISDPEKRWKLFSRTGCFFSLLTLLAMEAGGFVFRWIDPRLRRPRPAVPATSSAPSWYKAFEHDFVVSILVMMLISLLLWAVAMGYWVRMRR